jgi:hypothetical protein
MAQYSKEIVQAWFKAHGLTAIPEFRFDAKRKWRFDFAFLESKVALECQGGLFIPGGGRHSRGAALLKEHEKLNAAAVDGWRVLFTTPDNLCMTETLETIKAAIGKPNASSGTPGG